MDAVVKKVFFDSVSFSATPHCILQGLPVTDIIGVADNGPCAP